MESILTSIKKLLGPTEEDTSFDTDIIIHINTVLFDLCQLGVGPSTPFSIEDKNDLWEDFISTKDYEAIKTYMYMRVKLVFDPPNNASVIKAFEESIKKFEWSLNVAAESKTE